ncbi:ECs_2282 family putative zinc-binding protein [Testudinibacter sp. P80/BLE/0925]
MSNQFNIPDRVSVSCTQCGNKQLEAVKDAQGEFTHAICHDCGTHITKNEALDQAKQAALNSVRDSLKDMFKRR